MQIDQLLIEKNCPEAELFESVLTLDNQSILELGCGDATLTRLIASAGEGRVITAAEVDSTQHEKNLRIDDLPNVNFVFAGAENIPVANNSIDTVFMFKSLHHVPVDDMERALFEINRVLKPGGLAYISEPIYAGDFNEILRLFHDERQVRLAAFEALSQAVNSNVFVLKDEIFFNVPSVFDNFEQFANRVIGVTHSNHQLSDDLYSRVKSKFEGFFAKNKGHFLNPMRVDLLQKPV